MSNSDANMNLHDIAVIGMACRFPGAKSVEQFWQNLREGVESISFFSDEELLASGVEPSLLANPKYVKANAVLEDVDMFDASFFGFSPREAEIMDPQNRFFLEVAWEALERAGYDSEQYDGLIGVFGGSGKNYYFINNVMATPGVMESVGAIQASLTNDKDFLPTSVSYKLNLKGPSINVQTACSTSLVGIHLASQSLLNGECDMALAGGVSITLHKKEGYLHSEDSIYSSDGHCRALDAKADGMVGGHGVGIVILKRLTNAIEDGDQIYAVIKGSALNNDGSLKVGFAAPSVDGQAHVIAQALAVADVPPETVSFVETHGTGTNLGDPIEIAALTQAFRTGTQQKGFCALGAVKTNVGHTNTAAGVTGFMKTVLALAHEELPPTLHFEKPNPKIDLANSAFYVNTELVKWEQGKTPRRAGVSSFGMGGTNAHVILEEAPELEESGSSRPLQVLLLSAKTKSALDSMTTNLVAKLRSSPELNLSDVAYTLQIGRREFGRRRMLVCQNREEALKEFQSPGSKNVLSTFCEPGERPVAFMFPGQGAQHVNMGKELYDLEPHFRETVDRCCELLNPHLGLDLRDILFPKQDVEAATGKLKQTAVTQPAIFVIEYALASLWMAWGVQPQAMIGHSIGEYVAACLAGVFSLEDALALVAERGRLMQSMPAGSMLAVSRPASDIEVLLDEKLSIAAVNAPELCVVSGPTDAIEKLGKQLAKKDVECRLLHTSHAFHSEMMQPILKPFTERMARCSLSAPKIPFVSNLSGTWITAEQARDPKYWAQQLRQGVKFAEGVQELLGEPSRVLLEVGPGKTLSTLASMCLFVIKEGQKEPSKQTIVSSMRRPDEKQSDLSILLNTLGRLWLAGVDINWWGFYKNEYRRRVQLPTYPFERHRYWIEPSERATSATNSQALLEKNPNISEWFYVPSWKRSALRSFSGTKTEKRSYLVFSDKSKLSLELIKDLQKLKHEVFIITQGEEFSRQGDHTYGINPQNSNNYSELFKELLKVSSSPITVVQLWGNEGAQTEDANYIGFYSLLLLAQAIGEHDFPNPLQIEIISSGIHEVLGDETIQPEKSMILGPCKVIPQEFNNISCRNIDIVSSGKASELTVLAEQIISEIHSEPSDGVVAYRGHHRWIQNFERIPLDGNGSIKRLREGGVYLITGGLGGIGLALAEHLAKTVKAKLILIGRKELPPKNEWKEWLTKHDNSNSTSLKIKKVQELESLGAEVMVAGADVIEVKQMQELLKKAKQRFGAINGVVHSAGVPGGGMIQLKTTDSATEILAPKVDGTFILSKLFENEKLDFMVLCSSLASTIGGIGQIDYCAANAFMDIFAPHASKNGTFTVSISWDSWREVGMAVNTEVPDELRAQRDKALLKGMTSKEGMEAFDRILQSSQPHVLVSTSDLLYRIAEESDHWKTPRDVEDVQETDASESLHARPGLATDYVAPSSDIEKGVADIWQNLFGIEQIGLQDDFFELGGHSLLATRLLNKLRKTYDKADLSLRSFFENATVAGVAQLIENVYGSQADEIDMNEILSKVSQEERNALIEKYLRKQIAQALDMEPDRLPANGDFVKLDLESIVGDLIWKCRRDFRFRIYRHEILKMSSLQMLVQFIADELDRISGVKQVKSTSTFFSKQKQKSEAGALKAAQKNKRMIFLLSAPRSGSTLLRLMLAGHSRLFCPPELGLLGYTNIGELWKHLSEHPIHAVQSSPVSRTLMELMDLTEEESEARFEELVKRNSSIQEVYQMFQEQAGSRTLVDKTPSYALNPDALQRCEAFFDGPKYVHLVRHPYAMIESAARYRLQTYFGEEDVDPYLFADMAWSICNNNLLEFFKTVDKKRYQLLYYEELVRDPKKVMVDLCEFLDIPFEKAVLHPYEDGRMIDGPGDLNIFEHEMIDPSLGEVWKKIKLPRQMSETSRRLATYLNYELPHENKTSKIQTELIEQDNAQDLLANLDNLSDEEVNTLLNKMITSEGKKNV